MKDKITIGKPLHYRYGLAMEITTQAEADAYFEELVKHNQSVQPDLPREKAEEIERSNLGYYAGYYGSETRERVERLFRCEHPVFGAIAKNGQPTSEEAFEAGIRLGATKNDSR